MTYDDVAAEAEKLCLTSLGGFHPIAQDQAPEGCQTLILLGTQGAGILALFSAQ